MLGDLQAVAIKVDEWIAWTGDLLAREPFADLLYPGDGCPWLDFSVGDLPASLFARAVSDRLLADSSDFPARFVGLSASYHFSRDVDAWEKEDSMLAEDNESDRAEFGDVFKSIFKYLIVEHCADPARIHWELRAGVLAGDWEIIQVLVCHTQSIGALTASEAPALKSLLGFQIAFRHEFEAYLRKPSTCVAEAVNLFLPGKSQLDLAVVSDALLSSTAISESDRARYLLDFFCALTEEPKLTADKGLLRQVVHHLEDAFEENPALPPVFRGMLAKTLFRLERFRSAADEYTERGFWDLKPRDADELFVAMLRTTAPYFISASAEAYKLAGDARKAVEQIDRLTELAPRFPGAYLRRASLCAQLADYEGVVQSLRREIEVDAKSAEDWRISTILAFGSIRLAPGRKDLSDDFIESLSPDLFSSLRATMAASWDQFRYLPESVAKPWIAGLTLAFFLKQKQPLQQELEDAALTKFAKAVELAYKHFILRPFRELLRADRARLQNVEAVVAQITRKDHSAAIKFVLDGNPRLMLGELASAIEYARASKDSFSSYLNSHIQRVAPAVLDPTVPKLIRDLACSAGVAKHEDDVTKLDVNGAIETAQKLINKLPKRLPGRSPN